jgi:hypothetical protein
MACYLVSFGFFGSSKKDSSKECHLCLAKLKSKRMRFQPIILGAVVLLTACSTPRHAYHFDHYDYNSGRKTHVDETIQQGSPLQITEEIVVASAEKNVLYEAKKATAEENMKALAARYKSMSKDQKKDFRTALKKDLKSIVKKEKQTKKGVESIGETKAFDTMLALAIVFGAAGIVFTVLASVSNIFWVLGAVAIVIGAYFFIRWVNNGNG